MKYEYKFEHIHIGKVEENLNAFGQDGWEVVGYGEGGGNIVRVVLKREISDSYLEVK